MLPSHRTSARRIGLILAVAAATVLFPAAASQAAGAARASIYAAPHGHGRACSATVPCSIQQAKLTAAERTAHMTGDLRVVLAGGTYALAAPLTFGPADSGRNGHRVIWHAAPGQRPVISGGTPITGFTPSPTNPLLWSARVPASLRTRQLYADGIRIPRASGPSPVGLTQTSTGYTASDTTLASWRNPQNIEFVFDAGNGAWTQPRCDVAGIAGTAIRMREPCWSNLHLPNTPLAPDGDNPAGGFPGLSPTATPTVLENAFELLSPGRWYLDESAHLLYYAARPSDDVRAMHFVAPTLQQLLTTTSTADNPLHDVTFQGLEFAYATWLQPSGDDGFAEMQANMTVTGPGGATSQGLCGYVSPAGTCPFAAWTRPPAAVDLVGTKRVSVLNNTFTHLGSAGLGLFHGIDHDLVEGNEITDVSGIGIEFGAVDDPQPMAFATRNLARGRPARQSSTAPGGAASRAVDGADTGRPSTTRPEANPWWQVDLGTIQPLWMVNVFNRTDRVRDYWVFVSASPFNTALTPEQQAVRPGVWSSHQTTTAGTPTNVPADTSGRYVMVQLAGHGNLSLAEVQVRSGAETATGNTISNNYVHRTGVEYTGAPGIFAGYSRGTTITHNELADLPYSGISFGWGGWHTNGTTPYTNPNINADNVISDNLLYHVMQVRSDGGPIYTNGPQGTSLAHGLTISGNVTFANRYTSFANYNDEGGAYITMDGNVQYMDGGNFNGGCSTTGHTVVKNNYRVGPLNVYVCDNVGSDFVDGGGNLLIPSSPSPGDIPAGVLSAAGLRAGYTALATRSRPVVAVVSPIRDRQVLVSGSGFTAAPTVSVDGHASPSVTVISSNHLAATVPAGVVHGDVTVSTPAGTSAVTTDTYTYDPSLDIAVGRAASQSSTAYDGAASRAVDGNTDGSFYHGSVSHTDHNINAWWQVDLGDVRDLQSINLYNRTDCCADRLTDYWVFSSATPFDTSLTPTQQAVRPGVWSNHQTGTAGTPTRIPVNVTGRYVMVQLSGTNYLALAEVQVFAAG